MRRVVSVFLERLSTDRLRRTGGLPENGPSLVARREGSQRLIAAVSAEAQALGLRPGQTVTHAQALHPGLAVAEAAPDADAAWLLRLARGCLRYAPLVGLDPPAGLFVETTGADHLFGGEAALLADLRGRLAAAGFAARVAVAATPGAAHALARFAPLPETVLAAAAPSPAEAPLAGLPLAALRLPEESLVALRRVGVERVGQLAALPRGPLARRYGRLPLLCLDQAAGAVAEPIAPLPAAERFADRLAFPEPLLTPEALTAAIAILARAVCARLERAGQGARQLDLLFGRVDGTWQAIRLGTARPSRDPAHLQRLLAERLEGIDPGLGIEAMRLEARLAERLAWVQRDSDCHDGGPDDDRGMAELIDRLCGRFGQHSVFRVARVQSRVPERSLRRLPPLAQAGAGSWPAELPRPVRLIDPPLPVEALALLPDAPPVAFVWRRVRHRVRRADGPERVFGEWWRRDGEMDAVRDYFAVEDDAGRRFWLFRRGDGVDPATGDLRWFLHGMF
jgi:protein ImuB